jgi:hypothetical protein
MDFVNGVARLVRGCSSTRDRLSSSASAWACSFCSFPPLALAGLAAYTAPPLLCGVGEAPSHWALPADARAGVGTAVAETLGGDPRRGTHSLVAARGNEYQKMALRALGARIGQRVHIPPRPSN